MPIVSDVSSAVLGFADKLSFFVIPAAIAIVVALFLFAKYSFKLLGVLLPLLGATIGAYIGADLLGGLIGKAIPAIADFINPAYLVGIVIAVILAFVCAKYYNFTLFLVGGGLGYIIIGAFVKSLLIPLDVVQDTAKAAGALVTDIVGLSISIVCGVVLAIVVMKYFKQIFTVVASAAGVAAAVALAAIIIFAKTTIIDYALIAGAAIGLIVGIKIGVDQLRDNWYYL